MIIGLSIGCIIFILWIITWALFAFTDDDDDDNLLYVPTKPDGTVMGYEIVDEEDGEDLQ